MSTKRHHPHRIAFGSRSTSIGGRSWFLRLGPWSFVAQATWGVPWGQYIAPVYVLNKRTKLGRKLALRLWKPYAVLDVQKRRSR